MHTGIHTIIHTCVHTYREAYIHTGIHTVGHAYIHSYRQADRHTGRGCMQAGTGTHKQPYSERGMRTNTQPSLNTYRKT